MKATPAVKTETAPQPAVVPQRARGRRRSASEELGLEDANGNPIPIPAPAPEELERADREQAEEALERRAILWLTAKVDLPRLFLNLAVATALFAAAFVLAPAQRRG